jgi:N-acetylneuraminate lyase
MKIFWWKEILRKKQETEEMNKQYKGLLAAVFSPMREDGSLNLDQVKPMVDYLVENRIAGLYVCGSTGEGPSLTSEERRATAQAYREAAGGKVPVIVHVGHDSVTEACCLAEHAQSIGADSVAAVPPSYFKIDSLETLIVCLAQIASAAPKLPFYYYHIPRMNGLDFDMLNFLELAEQRIPSFTGIKYSALTVHNYQSCLEYKNGKYNILFGCDEMLLSGLSVGAPGAVGSTYNFAAPLYHRIIDAFKRNDMTEAKKYQALSVEMIRIFYRYRGLAAFKATMKLIGFDCGPVRLPNVTLTEAELAALKKELKELGFFDWTVSC